MVVENCFTQILGYTHVLKQCLGIRQHRPEVMIKQRNDCGVLLNSLVSIYHYTSVKERLQAQRRDYKREEENEIKSISYSMRSSSEHYSISLAWLCFFLYIIRR